MSRRQSSGFFETWIKEAFRSGTTTHYKTNYLGQKEKTVWHHGSGKQKTNTTVNGIFSPYTKTKIHGRSVEEGERRKEEWKTHVQGNISRNNEKLEKAE